MPAQNCPSMWDCRKPALGAFLFGVLAPYLIAYYHELHWLIDGARQGQTRCVVIAAVLMIYAVTGLWLVLSGIAPAVEEGGREFPLKRGWVGLAAIGGVGLFFGVHPWGAVWALFVNSAYIGLIAGGVTDLGLQLVGCVYWAGVRDGEADAVACELAKKPKPLPLPPDVEELLQDSEVRRAVLKVGSRHRRGAGFTLSGHTKNIMRHEP
jgi:hypothetical protein